MSCTSLLLGCLQGVYWEGCGWKEFKSGVVCITCDFIVELCRLVGETVVMKYVHSSQQPVYQISENLPFGCLPLCEAVSPCFHQLKQKLKERSLFEYLLIDPLNLAIYSKA